MPPISNDNLTLGVLGSGIVGLCTAWQLQNSYRNARVHLLSAARDQDTTSYGAAGLFAPYCFNGPDSETSKQWLKDSWTFWNVMLQQYDRKICGVERTSGYSLSNVNEDLTKDSITPSIVPKYKILVEDELESLYGKSWKYGVFFESLTASCETFLPFALEIFEKNSGIVEEVPMIQSFRNVDRKFDYVFNCTGLGARKLCADPKLIPIRGQTRKVRAPWIKNFVLADQATYAIPNVDVVTLGGSQNYHDWDRTLCPYQSRAIEERCQELIPSLKDAELIREWAGLRPYRDPCRVEYESVNVGGGQKLRVIHNYGHGGSGVTLSPGTGAYSVRILGDQLRMERGGKEKGMWSIFNCKL